MDLQLDGLRVLITAGASGIGLATARAFAREGARVHICDVDHGALDAVARTDSALSQSVCDVSDRGQVAALFDNALAKLGGLDVLVNNAGIARPNYLEDMVWDDLEETLSVHLLGAFH